MQPSKASHVGLFINPKRQDEYIMKNQPGVCLPAYLITLIFEYVQCSCQFLLPRELFRNPCDYVCCVPTTRSLADYMASGGNAVPTCEWQRTIVSLGTDTGRDLLRYTPLRCDRSMRSHPDDKRTVLTILRQYGRAVEHVLKHASKGLLEHASARLRNDKDVVTAAVTNCGYALEHASARLRNDKKVVLAAVRSYGKSIRYASARLRENKDVVLAAVTNCGYALRYASVGLCENKEVVTAAVRSHGKALEHVSARLRNDKGVVLVAVACYGYALRYASSGLRDNKEVVLTAVGSRGKALRHASPRLRNDKEVVLEAAESDDLTNRKASPRLRDDKQSPCYKALRNHITIVTSWDVVPVT